MYEDYYSKTGTKEVSTILQGFADYIIRDYFQVVFQALTKFLNENPDKASVGWMITFLWQNEFRKTVWHVKEYYKKLKEMEKDFDCE